MRMGTADIYKVLETIPEVDEAIVVSSTGRTAVLDADVRQLARADARREVDGQDPRRDSSKL